MYKQKIKDVLSYLMYKYPVYSIFDTEMLTALVFLVDWRSCIEYKKQATDIDWYFDTYGPWANIVSEVVEESDDLFERVKPSYPIGTPKREMVKKDMFSLNKKNYKDSLNDDEMFVIGKVVDKTEDMYYGDLTMFIYSLYPIQTSRRFSNLNLVDLAKRYEERGGKA